MKQYSDLVQDVLDNGDYRNNRTGIPTRSVTGRMVQYNMADGFPAVTTKRLAFKSIIAELLGFLRGYENSNDFEALGSNVWRANAEAPYWLANEHHTGEDGYLGPIYGSTWVNYNNQGFDQVQVLLDTIKNDPTSRRMRVTAWNPLVLDRMALPPCHTDWSVTIDQSTKKLNLLWNQRSVDVGIGLPYNIASYAALLHILCRVTGHHPGTLTGFLADTHVYESHVGALKEQLSRKPLPLPELVIDEAIGFEFPLREIEPKHLWLKDYSFHPTLKMEMAV